MTPQTDDFPAKAVRWRIVALLSAFSLISYALRTNISIAAALMRADLHLSQIQIGYVFSAFLIGYAVFQAPAGALGDRFGPRVVLTVAAAMWGVTTVMTGALPGMVGGAVGTLAVLLAVRFLLGVAEAATYPVAMSAVGVWMPPSERAFANSLVIAGMALGSAFIPPVMARPEGPYWSTAVDISGPYAGTAGGIMNTAGNLGGVAQASIVPLVVQQFGWIPALATGSMLALVSALLWLFIRVDP